MRHSEAMHSEALVAASLKRHLLANGLKSGRIGDILIDAHPSYLHSPVARQLEPMGTVWIGSFRPDLVCTTGSNRQLLVAGFEVKARFGDWAQGLAQARSYRTGVHQAWLALPAAVTPAKRDEQMLERDASESGVGVMLRRGQSWSQLSRPADPRPAPDILSRISAMLAGVPVGRRLQLNHPLNYLIVPYLLSHAPTESPMTLLERHWPDLGSSGTRRHAIDGALALRLIDRSGQLTAEGASVADLMSSLGFSTSTRPSKNRRLADVAPSIAAITRLVLLWQAPVRLIMDALRTLSASGATVQGVLASACRIDEPLATSVFLSDPSMSPDQATEGSHYCPSTVFKLKQVMWHAGLLAHGAHASSGGRAERYSPQHDHWQLQY